MVEVCSNCNFSADHLYSMGDGLVCKECLKYIKIKCTYCNDDIADDDDMVAVEDGNFICSNCLNNYAGYAGYEDKYIKIKIDGEIVIKCFVLEQYSGIIFLEYPSVYDVVLLYNVLLNISDKSPTAYISKNAETVAEMHENYVLLSDYKKVRIFTSNTKEFNTVKNIIKS